MADIRLLALDLDDTLLTTDLEISPRNREAVRRVEDRGIVVVLASGRTLEAQSHYAQALGMWGRAGFLIADNGSSIYDTKTRQPVLERRFETELWHALLEEMDQREMAVQVYTAGKILATRHSEFTRVDSKLSGLQRELVPNLKAVYSERPKKMVIPGDPAVLPGLRDYIREKYQGQVNVFISKPYFLEILPAGADKGTALEFVAQALHIPRTHVMAFGDAANDLGMISWAAWGVAMKNALPEVKAAARLVTPEDHDNDGVALVLETLELL